MKDPIKEFVYFFVFFYEPPACNCYAGVRIWTRGSCCTKKGVPQIRSSVENHLQIDLVIYSTWMIFPQVSLWNWRYVFVYAFESDKNFSITVKKFLNLNFSKKEEKGEHKAQSLKHQNFEIAGFIVKGILKPKIKQLFV